MSNGLEDVVAAETVLSDVDGLAGRLVLRGASLDEIAGRLRFEAVVALLFEGFFDGVSTEAVAAGLGRARAEIFAALPNLAALPQRLTPTDAVRAVLALCDDGDDFVTALRLLAAPAVVLPAWIRLKAGSAPVAPDEAAPHAADMLRMLAGHAAPIAAVRGLDTYLVTVSDHGLNASTFAARVVASTGAGLVSSVLAGIGALKGPLHGGAPGPVLDMLDAIGTAGKAEAWISDALDRGERLMGFGHRIYRVRDPRADALKKAVLEVSRAGGGAAPARLALAEAVEAEALRQLAIRKPGRPLQTNVEFYTALLLDALGFPRSAFTAVFATGRIAGWIAHAREQALQGRLIRPQSRYIGPRPQQAA